MSTPPFENFQGVLSGLKVVALTILELMASNASKFRSHVTLVMPPFQISFTESCPRLSLVTWDVTRNSLEQDSLKKFGKGA